MKIRGTGIALLIFTAFFVSANELPKALVLGLAAEGFKEREVSQNKLLEWAKKKKKSSARLLYQQYRTNEEPEVRQRCFEILKGLSDQDYLSDGKGFLGITMQADIIDLPGIEEPSAAVRITNIVKNGPAEKFGLEVDDVIITLNGKNFQNEDVLGEFSSEIAAKKPLDEVILGLKRVNGKIEEVKVVLSRHPGQNLNAFPQNLHLLDEQARERHFETWLKKLAE